MTIAIYGLNKGCKFCDHAVELCEREGLKYQFFDIDEHGLRDKVRQLHGTVPYIKIGDRVIGGYQDLLNEHQNGTLTATSKRYKGI